MKQRIDEVLLFSRSNRLVYQNLIADAKTNNGIMPFVGEDLIKCIYGSRDDFVREVEKKTPKKISGEYINTSSFLDILDRLISIHQKTVIDGTLLAFYAESKIDDMYLKNQAISLVPYINGSHCITANIDNAIDHAYMINGKSPDVTHPLQRKKLTTLVRGGVKSAHSNIVLKIHGDVLSNAEQRIITNQDYVEQYKEASDFYKTIAQWLQSYITLFVGVDICKDSYLFDLLKQLHSPGVYHYAIVGCKDDEEEITRVYTKLVSIGIQPILYDVDKNESLEILLHKFLMDTNNMPHYPMEEIDYKYSHHDLVGRNQQIEELVSFLNKEDRFLWTIIVGNRLTGRTKLAYEISRLYASDWEWYIIEPEEIDDFISDQEKIQNIRKKKRKLLVTFDNFHWYKGSLEKIFNAKGFMNMYSEKIRFIFVLYDHRQSVFGRDLPSLPLELRGKILDSVNRPFLITINPLSIEEIMEMCHRYIYYRGYQLGIGEKEEVVLQEIDSNLREYIYELYQKNEPNILSLSLLKVINLVNEFNGDPYLRDSELAAALFEITVTLPSPPAHSEDINYEEWYNYRIERDDSVRMIKEYYKNKEEQHKTGGHSFKDDALLKQFRLETEIGEKGGDKHEG